MPDIEINDYRVFRFGLVVYGLAASAVGLAVVGFVACYIPMLVTGDESNLLSSLFQLFGSVMLVVGIGITGFCAPIPYFLPRDDEKRLAVMISLTCILGAMLSLAKQQLNSLFHFEYASLLFGTSLFLAQFVFLTCLLRGIAIRAGRLEIANQTKRLLPWMFGTWILPCALLLLTWVFQKSANEDTNMLVYAILTSILLLAILVTSIFTTVRLVSTLWKYFELLGLNVALRK